ncbi:U7 snRNA-associated Sm-like protein LSm11 isoform X2 [Carassius carassius]|uniref:U7 snRNA-associated Sm-like protein LSm11 isoform X2 n=1 Tax=Carassius carassius TaxID=217509 RepID=UPI0028689F81|nr:U7 snRNA-associated Sm-like protein LSm11 isoform X2 [Carassius carassius]
MEEGERESESERRSAPSQTSDQQTTTETSRQTPETEEDDVETKLDISSDKFDPLLALYSPQVPLPFPNIRCFNNIAEYESFMKGGRGRAKPENVEKRLRKAQKGKADPERIERLKRLMVNNPVEEEGEGSGVKRQPRRRKAAKNVLTRMPLHTGSPLGELNRCVQEKIRVKVHIRTFKGLRGVCSGFVVAFDKFWNLLFEKLKVQESVALSAVENQKSELHSSSSRLTNQTRRTDPRHTQERSEHSEKDKTTLKAAQQFKTKPKVEYGRVHTRHVNQLFIRGENILLVNLQLE